VYRFGPALRAEILARLGRFVRRPRFRPELRQAAVAVTIVPDTHGEATFLLTERAAGMRSHARQYALPGGRVDEAESAVQAALRELREEVGLCAEAGDVLGTLDDYTTRSGYVMTPVVVWAEAVGELVANPAEVGRIHRIPLVELDHPRSPRLLHIPESEAPVIQLRVLGDWLHAPTAAVLYQFREVALHGRVTRVAHYEQPVWAWK
jgi:8-oxo-dGTP pyrophosphatase MutT (NUDIX family)